MQGMLYHPHRILQFLLQPASDPSSTFQVVLGVTGFALGRTCIASVRFGVGMFCHIIMHNLRHSAVTVQRACADWHEAGHVWEHGGPGCSVPLHTCKARMGNRAELLGQTPRK